VGGLFSSPEAYRDFESRLCHFKQKHFPGRYGKPLVLHRADIIRKSGPFSVLRESKLEAAFNADLLRLLGESSFTVVGVVLDKLVHGGKAYRQLSHSYHYCLHALLERYCGFLSRSGRVGDACVESRGRNEDRALQAVYRQVFNNGTAYLQPSLAQAVLSSTALKVMDKTENCAGLQLADLIAHPVTRDVLRAHQRLPLVHGAFTNRVLEVIGRKYNMHPESGRIDGYGRVML
jgi:hypothetical protein